VTDALLSQLADFGALGIFAAFLMYQHFTMQKKMDQLIERFQAQLNDIRAQCDAQEEKLRDRYDSVIAKYEEDAKALRDGLVKAVEDVARKLDTAITRLA
jgi:Skp family chaperone for outer membrane proteins